MALAKEIPAEIPPVVPPRPRGVVLELTWDEFLLLRAAVGQTSLSENREKAERDRYIYASQSKRPRDHLNPNDYADIRTVYSALHKLFIGE